MKFTGSCNSKLHVFALNWKNLFIFVRLNDLSKKYGLKIFKEFFKDLLRACKDFVKIVKN